ncbi:MAG: helix-turn-helix transcriptional regulator [Flavobacteriales bacterium]
MRITGKANDFIELKELPVPDCGIFDSPDPSSLTVIWFKKDNNHFVIDGKPYEFKKNEIIFLTEFHKVKVVKKQESRFLRFNRSFYCIIDHDQEVGCKGVLFYGASTVPIIRVPEEEVAHFQLVWDMFVVEMKATDNLQIEMLQMMLKRYLILCTRVHKKQLTGVMEEPKVDLIREFNFLVETHFKTKHSVSDYADLLFKSPKTLSNLFSKVGSKTPLQYIHDRKMLEARRLLIHSKESIKQIAFEVGFEDIQSFSRFFKKNEGVSPSKFQEMMS